MKKLKYILLITIMFLCILPVYVNASINEGLLICESDALVTFRLIGYAIFIIKILVPIIIILLATIDYGKAVVSSDEKAIKDSTGKLIKRLIAGIIIFFIPTLLSFILGLLSGVSDLVSDFDKCETCVFNPTSSECEQNVNIVQNG